MTQQIHVSMGDVKELRDFNVNDVVILEVEGKIVGKHGDVVTVDIEEISYAPAPEHEGELPGPTDVEDRGHPVSSNTTARTIAPQDARRMHSDDLERYLPHAEK